MLLESRPSNAVKAESLRFVQNVRKDLINLQKYIKISLSDLLKVVGEDIHLSMYSFI